MFFFFCGFPTEWMLVTIHGSRSHQNTPNFYSNLVLTKEIKNPHTSLPFVWSCFQGVDRYCELFSVEVLSIEIVPMKNSFYGQGWRFQWNLGGWERMPLDCLKKKKRKKVVSMPRAQQTKCHSFTLHCNGRMETGISKPGTTLSSNEKILTYVLCIPVQRRSHQDNVSVWLAESSLYVKKSVHFHHSHFNSYCLVTRVISSRQVKNGDISTPSRTVWCKICVYLCVCERKSIL